nr:hypothetical protein [Tanacetum cinerariifolium]
MVAGKPNAPLWAVLTTKRTPFGADIETKHTLLAQEKPHAPFGASENPTTLGAYSGKPHAPFWVAVVRWLGGDGWLCGVVRRCGGEVAKAPIGGVAIHEPTSGVTRSLLVVEGKWKGIATDEQVTQSLLELHKLKKQSTTNQYIFQRRILETHEEPTGPFSLPQDDTSTNVVCNTPSPTNTETGADTKKSNSEGDTQILNVDEERGKANVESKVESMVTIRIHQASSSAPPLSTPINDLTTPKPVSPPTQEPAFTATTETTTTTLLPPPPLQQQSTTDPELANHDIYAGELRSVFKIDNYINETIKEVVQNALQALVRERFGELLEFYMKEILRDRMFESGSYRSQPEHATLYEALEESMDRENRDEFVEETAKSCKRRRDDQDPHPPPSKDLDQNKKKRHDSEAYDAHISDSEDTSISHLPKIKTRPDWLKLVPKEERSKTSKLDYAVPPNDLPETENKWANAISNAYKDIEENKLIQKTGDIRSFIKCISFQFQMEECHSLLTDQIDLANLEGHRVVPYRSKPLPLGGPPDFGVEELVPSLWIESECEYDIGPAYGISNWWFKRKDFYIIRHGAPFNCRAVRSHMRIRSVVNLKTFSRYGNTYLKEIVLR